MSIEFKIKAAAILVTMLCFLIGGVFTSYNDRINVVTINKLETKSSGKTQKYLIFTPDEVYENTDNLLRLKFDSSDIYGKLEVGKQYEIKTVGYRVPFLSWYRNILYAKEIK